MAAEPNTRPTGPRGPNSRGPNRGGPGARGPRARRTPSVADPENPEKGALVTIGAFAGQVQAELIEKLVFINRCAKVVKGGRRFSFSALIVIGDKQGRVGFGFGKANEVSEAIRKAGDHGRRGLKRFAISSTTIPHEVEGNHGGGRVILKPASPGTGIKAGGAVRAVCDAVGIKNILAKSLGSSNHANVLKATLDALGKLRQRDEVFRMRGITVKTLSAN